MRYILMLVVFIAGCSHGLTKEETENLTPAAKVFAIKGEYKIALKTASIYEAQPRCTEVIVVACSDTKVVRELRRLVSDSKLAIDTAESMVRTNPNSPSAASLARSALSKLTQYMISKGVDK